MKIKSLLILVLVVGLILSFYLTLRHLEGIKIEKNSIPIEKYQIIDIWCSYSYKMSSNITVEYEGDRYIVSVPRRTCEDIENGLMRPELYYNKNRDMVFIKGYYMPIVYVLMSFVFSITLPLIGFFVYKNELNNPYTTM